MRNDDWATTAHGSSGHRAILKQGESGAPADRRLLVIAHPALPLSQLDEHLVATIDADRSAAVRDLYAAYQHTPIDASAERDTIADADAVVLLTMVHGRQLPRLAAAWLQTLCGERLDHRVPTQQATTFRLLAHRRIEAAPIALSPLQQVQTEPVVHHVRHLVHRAGLLWQKPILLHGSRMPEDRSDRLTRSLLDALWLPDHSSDGTGAETDGAAVRVS